MKYVCAWGCTTRDPLCDACDSASNDPDTGWGGFTDHYAGKHFNTNKEQNDYYTYCRKHGESLRHIDNDEP